MRIVRAALRIVIVALLMVAAPGADPPGVALGIPGRANATPAIAAADRFVAVAWGASLPGGATDIYSAVSRDGGLTFAPPVRVNDVDGNASLGGEQPPHVSLVRRAGHDPELVVVWTAKSGDGTRLLVARSDNGGSSFGRAAPIAGGVANGNRGWESTAVDRDGHVVAVWLDHRETANASRSPSPMQHEGHDHAATTAPKADGAVRAQLSKLYFARVDEPASTTAVAGGVCYCCKTAVATGPEGSIYAAWRHVYPGNIRDIAFTLSRDGGKTFAAPIRVSDDHWALDGCPENGPAMAVGVDNRVHVVWPTLVAGATADAEPTLALFYATTGDGRTFSVRQRIATRGVPRHPQLIVTGEGELLAAWDEEANGGVRRVAVARAAPPAAGQARRFTREVVSAQARADYPVLADTTSGLVLAWKEGTDRSVIRVQAERR